MLEESGMKDDFDTGIGRTTATMDDLSAQRLLESEVKRVQLRCNVVVSSVDFLGHIVSFWHSTIKSRDIYKVYIRCVRIRDSLERPSTLLRSASAFEGKMVV